jgi:hypothetical protein
MNQMSRLIMKKAPTSESPLHEYSTKKRSPAQSLGWLLSGYRISTRKPTREHEQAKPHEPLKSLKLEAEEFVVAFTEGPYRSSGWVFAWPRGFAERGPGGFAGEVRLLVRDCDELSGGGDGIDGIDPCGELALEML